MSVSTRPAASTPIDIPKGMIRRPQSGSASATARPRSGSQGTSGSLGKSVGSSGSGRKRTLSGGAHPLSPAAQLAMSSSPKAGAASRQVKKGGHGRGNWGKLGSEGFDTKPDPVTSIKDPNYDEDAAIPANRIAFVETVFSISPKEMREYLQEALAEYFVSADINEVCKPISEVATRDLNPEIVSFIVTEACERDASDRELASKLLYKFATTNAPWHVTKEQLIQGFQLVLQQLDDLVLDTPGADQEVAKFIARAIADDLVPPSFAVNFDLDSAETLNVRRAMKKAAGLVKNPQGLSRLAYVWGISGARSSVEELKAQIEMVIGEYLDTGYVSEAERCIREMHASYYHHELVYSVVRTAVESDKQADIESLSDLLKHLIVSSIVSECQLQMGIDRIVEDIEDIAIDTPNAAKTFTSFCQHARSFLPDAAKVAPERVSRKRSISLTAAMPDEKRPESSTMPAR